MSASLQFVVPTAELHGGIRVPLELASWLADCGWLSRVVGPGARPGWHQSTAPWISVDLEGGEAVPRADITIATFHTTVAPAMASGSPQVFHLCQELRSGHTIQNTVIHRQSQAHHGPEANAPALQAHRFVDDAAHSQDCTLGRVDDG